MVTKGHIGWGVGGGECANGHPNQRPILLIMIYYTKNPTCLAVSNKVDKKKDG